MTKVNYIYSTLALLLMTALLSSCIFDEDTPTAATPQDPVLVTFSLDVMSSAATKADDYKWNGAYPTIDANDFENRILTSDLLVLAYETNGTFVAELPILFTTQAADGTVSFTCAFDEPLPTGASAANPPKYKFMVLANCLSSGYHLSYTGNVPNVEALLYSIPSLSSWAAIPMWGVTTYEFKYGTDGEILEDQDLETIDVLRATAKIGVKLSDELAQKFTLSNLKINKVASNGYSLPKAWNITDATGSLTHDGSFRETTSTIADVNTFGTGEDSGTKYIYVPETANSSTDELAISLDLKPTDGSSTLSFDYTKGLKFRPYTNGTPSGDPYNIVRNHYYEYTIEKVNQGKSLVLTLTVKDWDVVSEDITFTDEISVAEEGRMVWDGPYLKPGDEDASVLYIGGSNSPSSAVTATFKIETPVGATWYANFEGDKDAFSFLVETTADDADCLTETTDREENGVVSTVYWKKATSVTGLVGEQSTLRIITNSNQVTETKSVALKVAVVTMDGRTIIANTELMPSSLSGKEYYQIRQNLSL